MIKKADIFIIIFVFVIISVVFSLAFFNKSSDAGNILAVYVDGKAEYRYSLPLYEKKEIEINNEYGYNKIIADKNSVYVAEADCKGHDCVSMGKIEKSGDFIICAPHRLVIRIEGGQTEELDAITY